MRRTDRSGSAAGVVAGVTVAMLGRAAVGRLMLAKLRRDVARLNEGDHRPFLANFADDAVLRFAPGEHRWAGDHRGKTAIERFLRMFVDAGLRARILDLWFGGPPWALTIGVRVDVQADGPDGRELYANRTAIVVRTRWGRIVEQQDFYEDTAPIAAFDRCLRELGVTAEPS